MGYAPLYVDARCEMLTGIFREQDHYMRYSCVQVVVDPVHGRTFYNDW